MNEKNEDLVKYMLENNLKPTFQRIKILEYLFNNIVHPTADDIYKAIVEQIPMLSKTTVYNTLNTFIKSGIIKGIYIEENEVRYDSIIEDHGHFKCTKCNKIYDVKLDCKVINNLINNKFKIEEKCIYFKGICSNCI